MDDITKKTLVIILAGGKGSRLGKLAEHRAKPAVPFAGKYRMVDFVLSNCINSNLLNIILPTQFKSQSLQDHLDEWKPLFIRDRGESLKAIQPQARTTQELEPYLGTADAVFENLYSINRANPEFDLILAGDHVYRMDYRDLILFHQTRGAELTVGTVITNEKELAQRSGVLTVDKNQKVLGFEEKPEEPKLIPDKPDTYLVSMGIYIFNHEVMIEELIEDTQDLESKHDFGSNIIPKMIKKGKKVFAFPFQGYWRDIGTIDAYYAAHMDLVSIEPEFNLYDNTWPWMTFGKQRPPAKVVFDERIKNSIISEGCIIDRGEIQNSVLSSGVKVGMDARIFDSVIMDDVVIGAGARIVKTIIDKKNIIPAVSVIESGKMNYEGEYEVTPSGIVVVPRHFS